MKTNKPLNSRDLAKVLLAKAVLARAMLQATPKVSRTKAQEKLLKRLESVKL